MASTSATIVAVNPFSQMNNASQNLSSLKHENEHDDVNLGDFNMDMEEDNSETSASKHDSGDADLSYCENIADGIQVACVNANNSIELSTLVCSFIV